MKYLILILFFPFFVCGQNDIISTYGNNYLITDTIYEGDNFTVNYRRVDSTELVDFAVGIVEENYNHYKRLSIARYKSFNEANSLRQRLDGYAGAGTYFNIQKAKYSNLFTRDTFNFKYKDIDLNVFFNENLEAFNLLNENKVFDIYILSEGMARIVSGQNNIDVFFRKETGTWVGVDGSDNLAGLIPIKN